jgi:anti-anti-sigma regulatory factor
MLPGSDLNAQAFIKVEAGRCVLVLDFAEARVPSAADLKYVIALYERLRASGSRLILRNVKPEVCEAFASGGFTVR